MLTALVCAALIAQPKGPVVHCKRCGHSYSRGEKVSGPRLRHVAKEAAKKAKFSLREGDVARMEKILKRESYGGLTTVKNPRSSAYGMWQFLNGTWKGTGIKKTDCPFGQTEAFFIYVEKRYGTIAKALAWHKRRGYY